MASLAFFLSDEQVEQHVKAWVGDYAGRKRAYRLQSRLSNSASREAVPRGMYLPGARCRGYAFGLPTPPGRHDDALGLRGITGLIVRNLPQYPSDSREIDFTATRSHDLPPEAETRLLAAFSLRASIK